MLKYLGFMAAALLPVAGHAQDEAAMAFGAREGIQNVSLSPDGSKVAYIVPDKGQGSRLLTVDLASGGQPKAALSASGDPERLSYCEWVSDARLICLVWMVVRQDNEPVTVSRLIAINADGSRLANIM
jgi:hypothetical protein